MRYVAGVGGLTLLLTILLGASTIFTNAEHVIDGSKNPGYLFVISGSSGSLDGDILTLDGVPNVIYFSDRPARKAGHMSVVKFLDNWHKGAESFKSDPPNATLSILDKDGAKNAVVELHSVDQKNGSLNVKIRVLQGEIAKSFGPSSLFIDVTENTGQRVLVF